MKINLEARALNAELRRAKTRARIMEAACGVIAAKGAAATIEDFVAAAGIARGTFYNYFQSAAELVEAVGRDIAQTLDDAVDRTLAGLDDPALQLAAFSALLARLTVDHPIRRWANVRAEQLQLPSQARYVARVKDMLARGMASGRFAALDPLAARTLVMGAGRASLRNIVDGRAGPTHTADVLTLVLGALGLAQDEAARIAAEALQVAADADLGAPG